MKRIFCNKIYLLVLYVLFYLSTGNFLNGCDTIYWVDPPVYNSESSLLSTNNGQITIIKEKEKEKEKELIIETIAGTGTPGYSEDGQQAINAELNQPMGIAVDKEGNIYFADAPNKAIRKIDTNGIIYTIAGNNKNNTIFARSGELAVNIGLMYPVGLSVDKDNNLYITDSMAGYVYKVDTQGIINMISGSGIKAGELYNNYTATSFSLIECTGIYATENGKVYFSNSGRQQVLALFDGGLMLVAGVRTGKATKEYSKEETKAAEVHLNTPRGIWVNSKEEVYFADSLNHVIRKVTSDGIILPIAGIGLKGYSGDKSLAINAKLDTPTDLKGDNEGNIYIVEQENSIIRKIDKDGIITTIAGQSAGLGFRGNGTPAQSALLHKPYGIALDTKGNIYITDTFNHRIRKISLK